MAAHTDFIAPEFPGHPGWQMLRIARTDRGAFHTVARFGDHGFEAHFTGGAELDVLLAALKHMKAVDTLYAASTPKPRRHRAPRAPAALPLFALAA